MRADIYFVTEMVMPWVVGLYSFAKALSALSVGGVFFGCLGGVFCAYVETHSILKKIKC